MGILGQLIQPVLRVKWGFLLEDLLSVSFDFQDSEVYPACSITFSGSPKGYAAYRRCIEEFIEDPILITIGYPNGSWLTTQYYYTGASLGSGKSPVIEVTGSAKQKTFLSSFYTGQYVDSTLASLPEKLQGAAGVPKEPLSFTTVGREISQNVKVKGNVTGTIGSISARQLAAAGVIKDNTPTAQPNGKPVITAPAAMAAKVNKDQPQEPQSARNSILQSETYGYIIGPGLIEDFSRSINWGPGDSENSTLTPLSGFNAKPASSPNNPKAPQGTRGKSPLETITETNNPQLNIEAKVAMERQDKAQCDGDFFMVPQLVGIKPRDVIFIPSMSLDYLEEWVLSQVSYSFEGGGCKIGVTGYRFDLGATQKLVSTETYNRFLNKLKSLRTIRDWESYYWRL